MAAPTFVAEYETSWSQVGPGVDKTTSSFDVSAGDVLVIMGISEDGSVNINTPTNTQGAETWTLQQDVFVSAYCRVKIWTAVMSGAKTGMTITADQSTGTKAFGLNVLHWTDSDGVGASSKTNASSGAPSLSLTTTEADSAICVGNGDWNASDGTSRTWRSVNGSAATERTYFRDSSLYTVYIGTHADAGAAGSKTVGLSAPSGQKYGIAAVEVLGTAGGGGTTHALSSTGTGTSTGSLAVTIPPRTYGLSATGTGSSTGSVNLLLAPGALSASGSGTTAGSAALSLNAALAASGTGQTAGSVDVTLDAAPLALSATGTGTTGGSLAVNVKLSASSSGTGTSSGSVDLTIVGGPLSLSATGTGTTSGSLAMTATLTAGATGTSDTDGSLDLIGTLKVSASGSSTSSGTAAITVRHGLAATGTGQTAGSLDVTIPFGDLYQLTATGTGTTAGSLEVTRIVALSATGEGTTSGSLAMIRTGQMRLMGVDGQTSGSMVLNLEHQLSASGSSQAEGSLALRISTHWLAATGHINSSGSLDLTEPTYSFSPPTHEEPIRLGRDHPVKPLKYYRLTYAASLVKVNGSWVSMRTPPPELLTGLTAGVDYFLGGFDYEIDQRTARDLADAGYTVNPI